MPRYNLARGMLTQQSTTNVSRYSSDKAVDGNTNVSMSQGSCARTSGTDVPWWQVDLKAVYEIREVSITNRGDCCGKL